MYVPQLDRWFYHSGCNQGWRIWICLVTSTFWKARIRIRNLWIRFRFEHPDPNPYKINPFFHFPKVIKNIDNLIFLLFSLCLPNKYLLKSFNKWIVLLDLYQVFLERRIRIRVIFTRIRNPGCNARRTIFTCGSSWHSGNHVHFQVQFWSKNKKTNFFIGIGAIWLK